MIRRRANLGQDLGEIWVEIRGDITYTKGKEMVGNTGARGVTKSVVWHG